MNAFPKLQGFLFGSKFAAKVYTFYKREPPLQMFYTNNFGTRFNTQVSLAPFPEFVAIQDGDSK